MEILNQRISKFLLIMKNKKLLSLLISEPVLVFCNRNHILKIFFYLRFWNINKMKLQNPLILHNMNKDLRMNFINYLDRYNFYVSSTKILLFLMT